MRLDTTRNWLALILVGGFSLVTFLTVILVVIGILQSKDGIEVLKNFSSVYSGFVGLVVGYYFGKSDEKPKGEAK
jgi:hypothetical protein